MVKPSTLYGEAIQCHKFSVTITTYKNFFGAIWSNKEVINIKLTGEECLKMHTSNECGEYEMHCKENECHFDGTPTPSYKYLDNYKQEGFVCKKLLRNLVIIKKKNGF